MSTMSVSKKTSKRRKISFHAECVMTAVIQDRDTPELLRIFKHQRDEVNIDQENHQGITPLHQSVLSNNIDAVKLLLSNGCTVNAQDVNGFSPLHTASACGYVQIVSILILFGADVFLLTNQHELPIDVAKEISVIRLLSEEMCARIRSDLYLPSLIVSYVLRFWNVFRKIVIILFVGLYHFLRDLRRNKYKSE